MKALDLVWLALKNLRGRRAALPALGFAICAFCICFAGAIWTSVRQEKSLPCELTISAQRRTLSGKTLAALAGIPGVAQVTSVLEFPVTIKTGNYTAQLTLRGMDASYLDETFIKGGLFPEGGTMPHIVLNEAACRQFSDGREDSDSETAGTETPLPALDWLNASFSVQAGGARSIVSRVCGVTAGAEGQEPEAYVSLDAARELLLLAGQSTDCTQAKARVENIGHASDVTRAAAALGLTAQGSDEELQKRWDVETGEKGYLLAFGMIVLLCSSVLTHMWERMLLLEQKEAWCMLLWLGMRERSVAMLFTLQAAMISLIGVTVGIIAALVLPSFLPQELAGVSVFMLPIPIQIIALCISIWLIVILLSIARTMLKLKMDTRVNSIH
jgi:hypothetical protein